MSDSAPIVLFTAFEPSGDAHAAPVIARLLAARPGCRVVAWGGPRMAEAGAEIVEETARDGSMGLGAISKLRWLLELRKRIAAWADDARPVLHVGVDSPAANKPIYAVTRGRVPHVVQMVAPQYWAWAPWRRHKLRRLVDEILCLLPFEEEWFAARGLPARYVGHPVIARPLDRESIARERERLDAPEGAPRIVILPGSRSQEIRANGRLLMATFEGVRERNPDATAIVIAAREELRTLLDETVGALPDGVSVRVGGLEGAIDWADLALNVSGTVSLDLTRQRCPMVAVYRTGLLLRLGSHVLLTTRDRLLPNIVARRRIVPEFIPTSDDPSPVVTAACALLADPDALERTRANLDAVVEAFGAHDWAAEACDALLARLDGG